MALLASFDCSFTAAVGVVVWLVLPLYAACLGVALSFLTKVPSVSSFKGWAAEGMEGAPLLSFQLIFYFTTLFLMSSYRGYEGTFFQGQLLLTPASAKFIFLVLGLLGAAAVASVTLQNISRRPGVLGLSIWALGPVMAVLWGLLPLVTQLTSALLVLELVSVTLIWALTTTSAASARATPSTQGAAPGFVHALIIFIWASGLSALTLLIGLGLTTLEGSSLNVFSGTPLALPVTPRIRLSEALFTFILLFKFLMGSGQFLLLTWYRFLPAEGLVFYLFYYYPAQLILGTTFFVGFFISAVSTSTAVLISILFVAALSLMSTLGTQTSPALTLAGSSFVGLSLLVLTLLNVNV